MQISDERMCKRTDQRFDLKQHGQVAMVTKIKNKFCCKISNAATAKNKQQKVLKKQSFCP